MREFLDGQQQLFKKLDTDSSGALSLDEWSFPKLGGEGDSPTAFPKFGGDGDSPTAFPKFGGDGDSPTAAFPKFSYAALDTDKNKMVSMREFLDGQQQLFKKLDTDSSGALSLDEWSFPKLG